jgi:hypothetical protein
MFKCPKTKKLIPTHLDIDLAEIDKLPDRVTFSQCHYCRKLHGWTPKDTFVSDDMSFFRVELRMPDDQPVKRVLFADNRLDKAREIFGEAVKKRPGSRYTIRERCRVLAKWPDE